MRLKSTYKITGCVVLFWSFITLSSVLQAQELKVPNLPDYDHHVMHFGFLLGYNVSDFTIRRTGDFNKNDRLYTLESLKQSGFVLGIVSDMKMGNNFDLRFLPDLSFANRKLKYHIYSNGKDSATIIKPIESTFLEFPVEIKFKSNRINNYRIFVLGGGKYAIDMVSQAKVKNKDKDFVKLKKYDFGYTIGAGIDCYMERFKMSFEIKMYHGINNLIVNDKKIYSSTIEKLNSKIFLINVTFE